MKSIATTAAAMAFVVFAACWCDVIRAESNEPWAAAPGGPLLTLPATIDLAVGELGPVSSAVLTNRLGSLAPPWCLPLMSEPAASASHADWRRPACGESPSRYGHGVEQQTADNDLNLEPGEPAEVVLDMMARVRPSVLEGSLFDRSAHEGQIDSPPVVDRQVVAAAVRQLEAGRAAQNSRPPVPAFYQAPQAGEMPVSPVPDSARRVGRNPAALRRAGRQLDAAANVLEDEAAYQLADDLRDLAARLRTQARALEQRNSDPRSFLGVGPRERFQ